MVVLLLVAFPDFADASVKKKNSCIGFYILLKSTFSKCVISGAPGIMYFDLNSANGNILLLLKPRNSVKQIHSNLVKTLLNYSNDILM